MWPWPLTSDLQYQFRIIPLFLGKICAKFEQNTLNDLISIVITRLFPLLIFFFLDLWPLTCKINRVHPLVMGNICAMFDKNTLNSLISCVHKFISAFVYCDLDLWPPNSIGFILFLWWTFCQVWWRCAQRFRIYRVQRSRRDARTDWRTRTDGRNHSSVTISLPQRVARG